MASRQAEEGELNALYGDVGGTVGEAGGSQQQPLADSLEDVYRTYKPATTGGTAPTPTHTNNSAGASTANAKGVAASDGGVAVYVGNLQWWTTDAEVESMCSEFGRIQRFHFFEDKKNGKSKGYALVTFVDREGAKACQEKLHGREINGKTVAVAFQHSNSQQQKAGGAQQQQQQGGYGQSAGGHSSGGAGGRGNHPYRGGYHARGGGYRGSGGGYNRDGGGGGGGYRDRGSGYGGGGGYRDGGGYRGGSRRY